MELYIKAYRENNVTIPACRWWIS